MTYIFENVYIQSIYSNIDKESSWSEFLKFIIKNSQSCNYHQLTYEELNPNHEEIGGFSEGIIISIVSNAIYEVGKYLIKDILKKLKSPSNLNKYEGDGPKGAHVEFPFPGCVTVNIKYKDNKEVEIVYPYPTYEYNYIDNIDIKLLDEQIKSNNKASVYFNFEKLEYRKGSLLDIYS